MHGAACLNCRDDETGYVSVNGKECWSQRFTTWYGSRQCGKNLEADNWNDASIPVKCEAEAVDGKLTVRVYSDLSSGPLDESFAIDNVVIAKISPYAGAWCYVCKSFLCVTRTGKPTLASTYSHPIIQSMV